MESPEQQVEEGAGRSHFGDFALTRLDGARLAERGFEHPSVTQRLALPGLLAGRNALVLAPSGSGRTALAAMLAVEKVDREQTGLQAIILVLTPETVVETAADIARVGGWPESAVLAVQSGLRADRIGAAVRKGAVAAVGTPARVLDLVERDALPLEAVSLVGVMEADLLVELGARPALERLAARVPQTAERLLCAAQASEELDLVARAYGIAAKEALSPELTQEWTQLRRQALEVAEDEKLDQLSALCARAHAEGRDTVVLARSALWGRWVREGLAWRGVTDCSVEVEHTWSDPVFRQTQGGGRPRLVVSYHVPLQPESWLAFANGFHAILVTPAEYWDMVRTSEPQQVASAPEPVAEVVSATRMEAATPSVADREEAHAPTPDGTEEADVTAPAPPEVAAVPEEAADKAAAAAEDAEAGAAAETVLEAPEALAPELQVREVRPPEPQPADVPAAEAAVDEGATSEPPVTEEAESSEDGGPRKRRDGPRQDGLTEAERVARRHIKRDAARKIERIDPEDAVRESERLVRESVQDAVYEQAFADEAPPALAAEAQGEGAREEAARRRRLEVAARLDEARRQLAVNGLRAEVEHDAGVLPPTAAMPPSEAYVSAEEPPDVEGEPLTSAEQRLVAFAQGVVATVVPWVKDGGATLEVHRVLAERLLQDGTAEDVIAVLLQHLFPMAPAAVASGEEEESGGMARLFMSLGRQAGINQTQLVRLVEEMAGVKEADLGRADVLARYSFLEVRAEVAERVIAGMNGRRYRGREIAVDRAKPPRNP